MADDGLTLEEVRMMAAEIGMTRLTEAHLQQLLRATKAARARRDTLPIAGLTPADEPALVFSLTAGPFHEGSGPSSLSLLPRGEGHKQPSE